MAAWLATTTLSETIFNAVRMRDAMYGLNQVEGLGLAL